MELQWTKNNYGFSYHQINDADRSAKQLIIALYDSTAERWMPATWAQELSWLARDMQAELIAPSAEFFQLNSEIVTAFLSDRFNHINGDSIRFIALGQGAAHACNLIESGYSGLLIAPLKQCGITVSSPSQVFGVLSTIDNDSSKSWIDSLQRQGVWVIQKKVRGEDYYYVDQHQQLVTRIWNSIDSTVTRLSDTVWSSQYATELMGNIPETVREGKYIELSIAVAVQGDFSIRLLNLSAQPVVNIEQYLGKGTHHFRVPTKGLDWGVYKLQIDGPTIIEKHRIMIRG